MSSFIELIETFEIQKLTGRKYVDKIDGLLNRFPKYELNRGYRIVLWQKYPKTADDYVSMKFCAKGRVPVYGIYDKRDLQLIAICVEGNLFAIDDCDLDPNLVPDLKFQRVILDIRPTLSFSRDRWKGDKFWTRNDDKSKLTKSCGTTESIYHVIPDAFRRTLPVPALVSRQKVDKINFVDLYGASESAYPRMPDVFRRALAAAALGAIEMVSTSIRDMCFDQFGISKENEDPEKAKQNQEHRQFVQLGCRTIKEVLGATRSYPLQGIMTRRSLQHRVLKDVHKGLSRIHLK